MLICMDMNARASKLDNSKLFYNMHQTASNQGDRAEDKFKLLFESKGYSVTPSNKYQNIYEHWDLLCSNPDRTFKVDVKAIKRRRRHDKSFQDEMTWIELMGGNKSGIGWLNGHADYIAFEQPNSFIIVDRIELIELVKSLVDLEGDFVSKPIPYKKYYMDYRGAVLTLIHTSHLRTMRHTELAKL